MSSDNGYVIRENKDGKYVFQMYFASDDEYPPIDKEGALTFYSLQDAVDFYGRHMHDDCVSEYGLKIDLPFATNKFYPLLEHKTYPTFCPDCGPGYRFGDEGCRHGPAQKKETKMKLQQFARNPLVVEGVQVTEDNLEEVAAWCDGEIHTEPRGRYIKVKVNNPLTQRQTKAFVEDWVLISKRGFKVYTTTGLENAFSQLEDDEPSEFEEGGNIFDQPQELQVTNVPVDPRDQISGKNQS